MPEPLSLEGDLAQNARNIMTLTEYKWPMWWENAGENMAIVRRGLDAGKIPERKGPAIIVARGPSVYKYNHLSILAKYREKIPTIISVDSMLKALIERGCTPDFVATVDGDPIISEFYKLHSDERGAKVDAVLDAVTTHPLTLKRVQENLKGNIYWFTHFFDNPFEDRCSERKCLKCGETIPGCNRISNTGAIYYMTGKKAIMQAPGNVGAFCWQLAYSLNCNPIILVGMDLGYAPETPVERTIYYNGLLKGVTVEHIKAISTPEQLRESTQKNVEEHAASCRQCQEGVRRRFHVRENPDFHNQYMVDPIFDMYRNLMVPFIDGATVQTINATGGGALHGGKIVGMNLEEAIQRYT